MNDNLLLLCNIHTPFKCLNIGIPIKYKRYLKLLMMKMIETRKIRNCGCDFLLYLQLMFRFNERIIPLLHIRMCSFLNYKFLTKDIGMADEHVN